MFRVLILILIFVGSVAFVHAGVAPVPVPTSFPPLDVIGKGSDQDVRARFQVVKIELAKDQTAKAYVINYGTNSQIRRRERQIRRALVSLKIDSKKVVLIRGGKGGDEALVTRIYLVPKGATRPTP